MAEEIFSLRYLLSLSIVLIILLFVGWFVFRQIETHMWKIPPGPVGLPLIGPALSLSKDPYKDLYHLNETYGKICCISTAILRFVVVSDYDTAKELLCHPAALDRPKKLFDFAPGKGGFSAKNGKQWSLERKFSVQALRNVGLGKELWEDIIRVDVDMLIDSITERKGEAMDIRDLLYRSGQSSILTLIWGRDNVDSLTNEEFKLFQAASKLGKEQFVHFICAFFPSWLLKFLEKLNVFDLRKRKEVMESIAQFARDEINKVLSSEDCENSRNFIYHYEKEFKKHHPFKTIRDDIVERLVGDVSVFCLTTDTAMLGTQWILYLMATYPEIQARIAAEIHEVKGRNVSPSWEDRRILPYTMACTMEMLRWVSLIPISVPRSMSETIEFHGYSIPKDTIIVPISWAINRDPKYWEQPDEFIPERFLEKKSENVFSLEGFSSFGLGNRGCPGEKVAIMFIFVYFAAIMQRYEVRTPSGEPPDLTTHYDTILEAKNQELCFIQRK